MAFRTSRTFDAIFLLVVAGTIWASWINRVAIGDWVYFLSYHPTDTTTQIASEAGLSEYGRRLLYRADPTFGTLEEIKAACDIERLGCIDEKGRVYILDDAKQHDQTIVTAAHEMLHLAYRRLTPAQKDELADLIDQAIAENTGRDLASELESEKTDEDRRDEAHSLLGTEYETLPPGLETYYKQYFEDRSKVVAAEAADRRD